MTDINLWLKTASGVKRAQAENLYVKTATGVKLAQKGYIKTATGGKLFYDNASLTATTLTYSLSYSNSIIDPFEYGDTLNAGSTIYLWARVLTSGTPEVGVNVDFSETSPGVSLSAASAVTDANGYAKVAVTQTGNVSYNNVYIHMVCSAFSLVADTFVFTAQPGSIVSNLGTNISDVHINYEDAAVSAYAGFIFYPDGTFNNIEQEQIPARKWFNPITSGIGSSYWIRAVRTSSTIIGTAAHGGSYNAWLPLTMDRIFSSSANAESGDENVSRAAQSFTISISTNAIGTNIVASGTFTVDARARSFVL